MTSLLTWSLRRHAPTSQAEAQLAAMTQPNSPSAHLSASTRAGTVLIVDDEPLVLRSLTHLLSRCPYTVVPCLTPHEAIRHISDGDVRVVVSDVMMPEMSGIDLLRTIRQHDPDLPVVLVTGKPALKTAAEAIEYGAFMYLVKPVNPKTFAATVERAAQLYRLAQTKRQAIELFGESAGEAERVGLEKISSERSAGCGLRFNLSCAHRTKPYSDTKHYFAAMIPQWLDQGQSCTRLNVWVRFVDSVEPCGRKLQIRFQPRIVATSCL